MIFSFICRRLCVAALLAVAATSAQSATPLSGEPLLDKLAEAAPELDRKVLSLATRAVSCT
ncbi:MAG: hypothetical protein GX805_12175, partial [Gammaproteobacteria bacterium]|nr:hypothetical protein [Gammaproteobacteria bacterium]